MTFNELKTVFNNDDLNPNAELIFNTAHANYVIDDVAEGHNDTVTIYLKGKQ